MIHDADQRAARVRLAFLHAKKAPGKEPEEGQAPLIRQRLEALDHELREEPKRAAGDPG